MANVLFTATVTVANGQTDSSIHCTQGEFSVVAVYIPTPFTTGDITFKTSMDALRDTNGVINSSPTMATVLDESGASITLTAGTAGRWYNMPQMFQGNFLQLICPSQGAARTLTLIQRRID